MSYVTQNSNLWTPKLVGEILVEMVRWLATHGGRVGPARLRSAMPELQMELADRLAEGWSSVQANEVTHHRHSYGPRAVSLFERALDWQGTYLLGERGAGRVLALWLRCRITKLKFDAQLKARGWSRATAYRKRDKALSLIAQGLTNHNESPPDWWRH
ncbi:hypothetical protein [Brucella anthropi]|uniref:hypothetical protein n=1 Tax=Brucella anthropi TaxID=529 RepID=UPI001AEF40CA|nr:hypothetical protein [Brucella anthropi]